MHLLIPIDEGCGVLEAVTEPGSPASRPAEQLGRAADFVTALVKSGSCNFYETESGDWVLELRFPAFHAQQTWKH